MKTTIGSYNFGDTRVLYVEEDGIVGLVLLPGDVDDKDINLDAGRITPLVKIAMPANTYPKSYAAGHSLCDSPLNFEFKLTSHTKVDEGDITTVTTTLSYEELEICHVLSYREGDKAVTIYSEFKNNSDSVKYLDLLSSFALGALSPLRHEPAETDLELCRIRSYWSAEGKLEKVSTDDLNMAPSWGNYGYRGERFGQVGSMPVRKFHPFAAVSDNYADVTWAVSLGCSASWQIELYREQRFFTLTGGLADYEFGHFRKTVEAHESFKSPIAYVAVGHGGVDAVSQRITALFSRRYLENHTRDLPLYFNEFCTTWGVPSDENIRMILDKIDGLGFDYFVIDCGWYKPDDAHWSHSCGDWIPSKALFPSGIQATVDAIREKGIKPGIWFEAEVCAEFAKAFGRPELLVHRDGVPLTTDVRRFFDTRKPEVIAYMNERITNFLKSHGFKYMKVDYNETIGVGCDNEKSSHSLGEGLYDVIECSKEFYRSIKREMPDFTLEACSSGGHRIEPAILGIFDVASFSDAHEVNEVPIIAANLHRVMSPAQSQIWAVLHGTDSTKRLVWSLLSGCLGALCVSGDVYTLSDSQWDTVREGIAFYRAANPLNSVGVTEFFGSNIPKWRQPKGWQGVFRHDDEMAYVLVHSFEDAPSSVEIPLGGAYEIVRSLSAFDKAPTVNGSTLTVPITEDFEAVGVLLKKNK